MSQIDFIARLVAITESAVLVLDLHGDDGSIAAGELQICHQWQQLVEIQIDATDVRWVRRAHLHRSIDHQPAGKTAEIPFRANVRPRTEDDK